MHTVNKSQSVVLGNVCYTSVGAGQLALTHKFNKSRGRWRLLNTYAPMLLVIVCLPLLNLIKERKGNGQNI